MLIWSSSAALGGDTSGIAALQALTIVAAAPFSLVMIGMCLSLIKALRRDVAAWQRAEEAVSSRRRPPRSPAARSSGGGRQRPRTDSISSVRPGCSTM